MQKTLFIKLSIIIGLCILFAVGLSMIQSLVYERKNYASSVIQEISTQHVRPQELITPFIVIPTTVTPECHEVQTSTQANEQKKDCKEPYTHLTPVLPEQTQAKQNLNVSTDTYQRGIYHATSYKGTLNFSQQYNIKANLSPDDIHNLHLQTGIKPRQNTNSPTVDAVTTNDTPQQSDRIDKHFNDIQLIIPVSDLRGVSQLPTVTINNQEMSASYPTTPLLLGINYVTVNLPASLLQNGSLQVQISLPLVGISEIQTIPLGQHFDLNINSNWHAPNFIGDALPNEKNFTSQGFDAHWQNQYLTINNNQTLTRCLHAPLQTCYIEAQYNTDNGSNTAEVNDFIHLNSFGVDFAEPNNIYLQTQRTMKYALLLILVSFGTFFLFEIIKSTRIHPIQYVLVGAALLVFYVLLLPLAEQVKFWQAYAIAAGACVSLIGWYAYYILGSVKRAAIFTALLSGLYGAFYGILTTEELNLLLGAVFCFIILAAVMYMTRKIDWYEIA